MHRLLNPSFAVALTALTVALGGTALAAGEIAGSFVESTRPLTFGERRS